MSDKPLTTRLHLLALAVLLAGLASSFLALQSAAAQDVTPPPDDAVNAIAEQMYCPVCEGVPLDACETKACAQWREDIRDRLAAGWNEQEIKEYFVLQYGDQVLAAPPARGFSLLMYIVPAVGISLGLVLLGAALRRWQQRGRLPAEGSSTNGTENTEGTVEGREERP